MSPVLELQEAMVLRLKGAVAALAGRVYDGVPPAATMPYASLGPVDAAQEDADCIAGMEIVVQWDVWSTSSAECMRAAEGVRAALHGYEPELEVNALVEIEHVRTARLRDPDGITFHAAVEFRAFIEQPPL